MEWDIRNLWELIKDSMSYIILFILIFFVIVYVIALQIVSGPSMEPNYYSQDILLLNKLHYRIFKPKRFEVVAVKDNLQELIIKRVIGLPGEKIEYKNNELYINNEKIIEEFNKGSSTEDFSLSNLNIETIPDGYYFVVGDNRGESTDSRDVRIGLIHKNEFIGKPMIRIWRIGK